MNCILAWNLQFEEKGQGPVHLRVIVTWILTSGPAMYSSRVGKSALEFTGSEHPAVISLLFSSSQNLGSPGEVKNLGSPGPCSKIWDGIAFDNCFISSGLR